MPQTAVTPLSPPGAVLDTNVVLDWLVFRQPACRPLTAAIEAGQLRWIGTLAMRDELAHVMSRGLVDAWAPDGDLIWSTWERHCQLLPADPPAWVPALRCSDPDDQKFVEFALAQAQWLISRDRAVLKLARKAAKLGLKIVTPEAWAM